MQAAAQIHAKAQFSLGLLYDLGRGVSADAQQAMAWYRQAAEQGHARAQFNLGMRYDSGQGVLQDYQKALSWYRRAADQGHARAQFNLGLMYLVGQGATADVMQAYKWFSLAAAAAGSGELAELGDKPERHRLLAEARMEAAQLQQAVGLVQEWRSRRDKAA